MVNQTKTIQRLNDDRNYEEYLVDTLIKYFLISLRELSDITEEEKDKIKHHLSIIKQDSLKHADLFSMLLQMVFEDGERKY